ncbi:hypothetical protein FN846DRAFT_914354 [Sphaerosporella brunnea]|uniref:Uncharacterized protein n=1 Tax=Sphaerosporella brunnea TaxID=1250544 RepID=A0A5J5ECV1_9PEZI|nr:hypothetical protein FN846DRAFT_914354 [Sphaerosporella brunnea]
MKFLEAYLPSKRQDLRTRVGRFLGSGGLGKSVTLLVNAANVEHARKSTRIKDMIGNELLELFATMLTREVKDASNNAGARLAPQSMTPEVASQFAFEKFIHHFEETAPLLVRLIERLCGATATNAQNDDVNVESEIDEGGELFFTDEEEEEGIDEELSHDMNSEEADRNTEDEGIQNLSSVDKKKIRQRRTRNKRIIVTAILSMILFAHSQWNNALQTIMGYWFRRCNVPKRVVAVLNQLGLCISYNSIETALQANSIADQKVLREKVIGGQPFGWVWDNLVLKEGKAEETEMNQKNLHLKTSAYVHMLHLPKPQESSREAIVYENIIKRSAASPGIGLPRSLIFREDAH